MFIWSSKDNVYILGTMYQCDSNIGIYIGVLQVHKLKFAVGNIVLAIFFAKTLRTSLNLNLGCLRTRIEEEVKVYFRYMPE